MTVKNVISRFKRLKPNQMNTDDLLLWISNVDAAVCMEILQHKGNCTTARVYSCRRYGGAYSLAVFGCVHVLPCRNDGLLDAVYGRLQQ